MQKKPPDKKEERGISSCHNGTKMMIYGCPYTHIHDHCKNSEQDQSKTSTSKKLFFRKLPSVLRIIQKWFFLICEPNFGKFNITYNDMTTNIKKPTRILKQSLQLGLIWKLLSILDNAFLLQFLCTTLNLKESNSAVNYSSGPAKFVRYNRGFVKIGFNYVVNIHLGLKYLFVLTECSL